MRLSTEVKIDNKIYECFEIRPKDLIDIYSKVNDTNDLKNAILVDLLPMLTTASIDEIKNMYPSEIDMLLKGVQECNAPFLKKLKLATKQAQFQAIVEQIKNEFLTEFTEQFAGLRDTGILNRKIMGGDSF